MTHALITGASSGIGRALAFEFARNKHPLVLIARRREKLLQLASELREKHSVDVRCLAYDLTEPQALAAIEADLEQAAVKVRYLVNNAGIGHAGEFADHSLERDLETIDLNVRVPVELCKRFLPKMLDQGTGKILNVASTGAFQPGPRIAVYYATKAFLLSFSEALSREVKGSGVTITALCPGSTQSEFHQRAGMTQSRALQNRNLPSGDEVAAYAYQALMQGKTVAVHGVVNRLLVFSIRFLPRRWVRDAVHWLQTKN